MAFGLGSKTKTKKSAGKKDSKKTEAQIEAEAMLKAAQERSDAGDCPFC